MYQTTVKGKGLFQAISQGYGEPVHTFGVTEKGQIPVSLVNIGLVCLCSPCVSRVIMPAKKAIKLCLFRWRVVWIMSTLKSWLESERRSLLEKQEKILAYVVTKV